MEKNFIDFFHVSEHVDHFKAIKVFSLRKKPEMVWLGGTPTPPGFGKKPNYFRFFLVKASLNGLVDNMLHCFPRLTVGEFVKIKQYYSSCLSRYF